MDLVQLLFGNTVPMNENFHLFLSTYKQSIASSLNYLSKDQMITFKQQTYPILLKKKGFVIAIDSFSDFRLVLISKDALEGIDPVTLSTDERRLIIQRLNEISALGSSSFRKLETQKVPANTQGVLSKFIGNLLHRTESGKLASLEEKVIPEHRNKIRRRPVAIDSTSDSLIGAFTPDSKWEVQS